MPQLSKHLGHFFGERERGDVEIVEIGRDSDAGEVAGGEDGGVGGFGDRDVDVFAGALGDGMRDLLRRAVETLEAIDAEEDGIRCGLFEGW